MSLKRRSVLFLKGRPDAHPIHRAYAEVIGANQQFEDRILRWHDIPTAPKIIRYVSWFMNGLFFAFFKEQVILTEGIRVPALIARLIPFRKKKIVCLMADESLYFIKTKRYNNLVLWLQKFFLNHCDAIICIGEFQEKLARLLVQNKGVKIAVLQNGLQRKTILAARANVPNFDSHILLFIGNGPNRWRADYKGLETMFLAIDIIRKRGLRVELNVVGRWDLDVIEFYRRKFPFLFPCFIHFLGPVSNTADYFKRSFVYLHCSNGDAFPTSVLEAMAHGLIPIISDQTGTMELVSKIDPKLIVSQDAWSIARKIEEVLSWPYAKRLQYSELSKHEMESKTAEDSNLNFKKLFKTVI